MLVHEAGVGMMIFGGMVTVGEMFAGGVVQDETKSNSKKEVISFFMLISR